MHPDPSGERMKQFFSLLGAVMTLLALATWFTEPRLALTAIGAALGFGLAALFGPD